jgi:AraC-like DNA-binding protein
MKLLRETNDTIADIASQVGYQTQGKFSSAFQSIVKMSPREYRKIQGIQK